MVSLVTGNLGRKGGNFYSAGFYTRASKAGTVRSSPEDIIEGPYGTMIKNDDDGLTGKVAIVTGGGAQGDGIGNGRAAALLMARAGAKVVVVDRSEELAARTVEMITDEGKQALAIAGDVTSEEDCQKIVAATYNAYGGVDILDNNVGVGSRGSVVDEDPVRWDRVMRINVNSMPTASAPIRPNILISAGVSKFGPLRCI